MSWDGENGMMSDEDMTKDVTIQVRCTAEEREAWNKIAEEEDRTLSAWIRRQCNLTSERFYLAKIAEPTTPSRPRSKKAAR